MPNPYHYFESAEVSVDRFALEIQLLKQLQNVNLLHDLDWSAYDTAALRRFQQVGIDEAGEELMRRQGSRPKQVKQLDFIESCIRKHRESPMKETLKRQKMFLSFYLNMIFVFVCLISVIGLFVYQYIAFNRQHPLFQSLDRPLTTKRRHLSFTDDLPILLLTFACAIILASIIIATRFSRKMILLGVLVLVMILVLLIVKLHQIVSFLSKYRELRWSKLYDYMYS